MSYVAPSFSLVSRGWAARAARGMTVKGEGSHKSRVVGKKATVGRRARSCRVVHIFGKGSLLCNDPPTPNTPQAQSSISLTTVKPPSRYHHVFFRRFNAWIFSTVLCARWFENLNQQSSYVHTHLLHNLLVSLIQNFFTISVGDVWGDSICVLLARNRCLQPALPSLYFWVESK